MRPTIREKIDWYAILFYIQHLLNTELILLWMMTTNWFLMYIYSLLNIGGSENNDDYLRRCQWDEIYYDQHYAQLILSWTSRGWGGWVSWSDISGRWDCLLWECWGCWSIHEHPRPIIKHPRLVRERPRSIHELRWYWSSHLHGYYRPVLQLEWCSRPVPSAPVPCTSYGNY